MGEAAKFISVAFGTTVRNIRLKIGISQEELGFRSGLDRTYISSVERGRKNPTLQTAWFVAKGLDIPLWELVRLTEEGPSASAKSNTV